MTTYLISLSAASLAFLLALHVRHVLQTLELLDAVSGGHAAGSALIQLAMAALDFLNDTLRHALIALAISAVSLAVYVWALLRPARWKAYSMLIVGLAYVWIGGAPPPALRDLLFADEGSLIPAALLALGHLYVATAAVQLARGARRPGYFADVRREREKALAALEELAAAPIAAELEDEGFRAFHSGLSSDDQRLFAGICGQIIAGFQRHEPGASRNHVADVRERWYEMRSLFVRYYRHLLEAPPGRELR